MGLGHTLRAAGRSLTAQITKLRAQHGKLHLNLVGLQLHCGILMHPGCLKIFDFARYAFLSAFLRGDDESRGRCHPGAS